MDMSKTNKHHIISYLYKCIFVSIILLAVSCEEFLDEVPDNRVALDNLDKAQQLLTNAYSISSYAFTDWMSDNVGFTTGVTIRTNHRQAYQWEDFTDGPTEQDTPIFFWFETYPPLHMPTRYWPYWMNYRPIRRS
jgi:hypothetical protein